MRHGFNVFRMAVVQSMALEQFTALLKEVEMFFQNHVASNGAPAEICTTILKNAMQQNMTQHKRNIT